MNKKTSKNNLSWIKALILMIFTESFILAEALPIDFFFDDWQVYLWVFLTQITLMSASFVIIIWNGKSTPFSLVMALCIFVFIKVGVIIIVNMGATFPPGVIMAMNELQLVSVIYVIIFYALSSLMNARHQKQQTTENSPGR